MLIGLARAIHRWRYRHRISNEALEAILRYEDTRGIDFTVWRTPKELAQMRRQERRAALRVVGGKRA